MGSAANRDFIKASLDSANVGVESRLGSNLVDVRNSLLCQLDLLLSAAEFEDALADRLDELASGGK